MDNKSKDGVAGKRGLPFRGQQALGYSGCLVEIILGSDGFAIRKSTEAEGYRGRLKKQISKQREHYQSNKLPFVKIPRILSEHEDDLGYAACMEYVQYNGSVDFFSVASLPAIDKIIEMLVAFVDAQIAVSRLQVVPSSALSGKLLDIERALVANGTYCIYRDGIRRALDRIDAQSIELPIGACHGDLTFSNIMIARDVTAIAIYDFLDSFIESPIFDIAKIRQDTMLYWSALMTNEDLDFTRFRQVMRYIDGRIQMRYGGQKWYSNNIDFIQSINLLRIAPYVKHEAVERFVLKALLQTCR
jgi:hypothetical protein